MKSEVLHNDRSGMQEILLTKNPRTGKVVLYLDWHPQFMSGYDETIYHHILGSMPSYMMKGRPFNALVLGGGDGLVARNILRFPSCKGITQVELDPNMIKFSKTHPQMRFLNENSFNNPRVRIINDDAQNFLASSRGTRYDVVVCDFPDANHFSPKQYLQQNKGDLKHLSSERFYRNLVGSVNPRVISVQAGGAFGEDDYRISSTLEKATGTISLPVRWDGHTMGDGCIIMSGKGVIPELAKLPENREAQHHEWNQDFYAG